MGSNDWVMGGEKPPELVTGSGRVPLRFVHHPRARRYVLRIHVDGTARVTIPHGGSPKEGLGFAQRHLPWIEKQLQRRQPDPVTLPWSSGTQILFRGERVRLEIKMQGGIAYALFAGQTVIIDEPVADLRVPVERHLRRVADTELVLRTFELASLHGLTVARVGVRNQRSRWGSCSARGAISLNWRLVQTPPLVRDYIILHELMHRLEMNHSRRFWRLVAAACPEYRQAEHWLKEHSMPLIVS